MADEPVEGAQGGQQPDNSGGAAVTRHESIPETYFDTEKSSYKFEEIGAALTEAGTLKAQAEERAKLIPAKPDDYKFELPKEFALPDGYKWQADPKDPIITGFRTLASELKLTQPEVERLVQFEATRQASEIKAQKEFDAEQTKALGANAEQRRKAASDFIDARVKDKGRAAVLKTMLGYAQGVEALEDIIAGGTVQTRGDTGNTSKENPNAELSEQIGKTPNMGRRLLDMANRPKS